MKIITPEERQRMDDNSKAHAKELVVRYDKYAIKNACDKRGLWAQVKEAVESAHKWDAFLLIRDLASDNPELCEILPLIRQKFGSDLVDEVLSESIAE